MELLAVGGVGVVACLLANAGEDGADSFRGHGAGDAVGNSAQGRVRHGPVLGNGLPFGAFGARGIVFTANPILV